MAELPDRGKDLPHRLAITDDGLPARTGRVLAAQVAQLGVGTPRAERHAGNRLQGFLISGRVGDILESAELERFGRARHRRVTARHHDENTRILGAKPAQRGIPGGIFERQAEQDEIRPNLAMRLESVR